MLKRMPVSLRDLKLSYGSQGRRHIGTLRTLRVAFLELLEKNYSARYSMTVDILITTFFGIACCIQ